jgi:hypothetical protein
MREVKAALNVVLVPTVSEDEDFWMAVGNQVSTNFDYETIHN